MSDGFTRTALIIVANAVNRAGLHVAVELLPLQENYSGHRNHLYGAATVLVDLGLIERWRVGRQAYVRALVHPVVLPESGRARRIRQSVTQTVAAKRARNQPLTVDPRITALRDEGFDRAVLPEHNCIRVIDGRKVGGRVWIPGEPIGGARVTSHSAPSGDGVWR